jgi:hypothetical protein
MTRNPLNRIASSALVGPLAALALAGALAAAEGLGYRVPNPNLLFALTLVWSGFQGGLGPGLASAGLALAYTALDWSLPGRPLRYAPESLHRLEVALVCMPAMAVLVGLLKQRSKRQQKALEGFLAAERERNRSLAEALARTDAPEGALRVCAWCRRVHEDDGTWVSFETHLIEVLGLNLTHGICRECREAMKAE